jgi:uncharacterized membrane protein YfcA
MTIELIVIFLVAMLAGGVASVSGFGIGSLLTPLLALRLDLQLAVAAVSIPHVLGTALRFTLIHKDLRKDIFISFGIWSAIGGLGGALLHNQANNPALIIIFACLLIFAGMTGTSGLSEKMRFPRKVSWLAGFVSGAFGGLVGNQGGIRSAALLGFDLTKKEFVATATGIGLIVDGARMPVYFASRCADFMQLWLPITVASVGVLLGTWLGKAVLVKIPETIFKRFVSVIILFLGISMLLK